MNWAIGWCTCSNPEDRIIMARPRDWWKPKSMQSMRSERSSMKYLCIEALAASWIKSENINKMARCYMAMLSVQSILNISNGFHRWVQLSRRVDNFWRILTFYYCIRKHWLLRNTYVWCKMKRPTMQSRYSFLALVALSRASVYLVVLLATSFSITLYLRFFSSFSFGICSLI